MPQWPAVPCWLMQSQRPLQVALKVSHAQAHSRQAALISLTKAALFARAS
jgi:hypothetical protein